MIIPFNANCVTTLRVVWIEIFDMYLPTRMSLVTTLRVVWIEICIGLVSPLVIVVTTLRVVWIEIDGKKITIEEAESPPCGWCGLK